MGGSHTFRQTKTFLVGKIEEQIIPSVAASATTIPLGTVSELMSAGTGLKVDTTVGTGALLTATPTALNLGTGYVVGDLILVEGGINGVLKVATIGALGAVGTLTVSAGGSGYSGPGSAVLTCAFPTMAQDLPHEFVIQDLDNAERVTISGIQATSGAYSMIVSVPALGLAHGYIAPFASILTPGVQKVLASADFNARLRNIVMTPKVDMDGESEKFATGDHRKDQSISGVRTGTITFQEKVAINLPNGTGCKVDVTVTSGPSPIDSIAGTPTTAHAGTGYNVGDILLVTGGGGDARVKVLTITPSTGAVLTVSLVYAGTAYTTAAGTSTATTVLQIPQVWDKFTRSMGHVGHRYTTVGYGLRNVAAGDDVTITLGVCFVQGGAAPKGQIYMFSGCCGDGSIGGEGLGKPYMLKGNYQGNYMSAADLTNANIMTLTNPDVNIPEKMLSNVIQTQVLPSGAALPLRVSKWEYAFGNKISFVPDQRSPSGYAYFCITDRDPKITLDPLLKPVSEEDIFTNVTGEQLVDVLIQSATVAPHMSVEGPNCQLMSPTYGNIEGHVNTARTLRCLGNNLGGGAAVATLSDECSAEILIGARA
jgi:hypothetical protein